MTFESLQLDPALLKAVQQLGFENPTPIQAQAIPVVLSGVDLLAAAQTGTGKTGGFALPILHNLAQGKPEKNKRGKVIPRALILAPTRELAAQIDESFRQFGQFLKLSTVVLFGGVGMKPQIIKLQRGVDIIIATPGRLLDLQQQGFADLSRVQTLVLDEADRMLDMGFIIDIKKIIAALPDQRQNLLFSATFSDEIRELAGQLLHDPLTIEVAPRNTTVESIRQIAHPVSRARKLELLVKLIKDNQWFQVLIFTRTKFGANKVSEVLAKEGIRSSALHGNKSQSARTAALRDFKTGRVQALVATDIAARGIDIDQLACVINYELPNISEDYVHRIGRTGRAGADGVAISLVTVDEAGFMQQIEELIQRPVEVIEIDDFSPPATETAQLIVMGRQALWGGIGRAPSRKASAGDVRAARQRLSQPRSSAKRDDDARPRRSSSSEPRAFGARKKPSDAALFSSDKERTRSPRSERSDRSDQSEWSGRADRTERTERSDRGAPRKRTATSSPSSRPGSRTGGGRSEGRTEGRSNDRPARSSRSSDSARTEGRTSDRPARNSRSSDSARTEGRTSPGRSEGRTSPSRPSSSRSDSRSPSSRSPRRTEGSRRKDF